MRFSRRRIGAFARVVGNTEAEYFDPIISSYDGFRDVIAPAVFAVVPGQQQLNELLNEVAPGTLPLLHGIHLEIDQPIVAGTPITIATRPMQQRISGDIGTLNTETIISDDDGKLLATLTQKLALISGSGCAANKRFT